MRHCTNPGKRIFGEAESRARFHYESLASPKAPFTIERREWWTLTSPNLVAIHIYFRV